MLNLTIDAIRSCFHFHLSWFIRQSVHLYLYTEPHIGHLYSLVTADIFARFRRLLEPNRVVHFLAGTDEHGSKIQKAANDKGIEPRMFCDAISQNFRVCSWFHVIALISLIIFFSVGVGPGKQSKHFTHSVHENNRKRTSRRCETRLGACRHASSSFHTKHLCRSGSLTPEVSSTRAGTQGGTLSQTNASTQTPKSLVSKTRTLTHPLSSPPRRGRLSNGSKRRTTCSGCPHFANHCWRITKPTKRLSFLLYITLI
jgi:hypothetical protein